MVFKKFFSAFSLAALLACNSSNYIVPRESDASFDLSADYGHLDESISPNRDLVSGLDARLSDEDISRLDGRILSPDEGINHDAEIFDDLPVFPPCDLPAEPLQTGLEADQSLLYSPDTVPLVEIVISPESWEAFCSNSVRTAGGDISPTYTNATVRVGGVRSLFDIGLRAHGRSSLNMFLNPGAESECLDGLFEEKPNFKISFNRYAPGYIILGKKKMNLLGSEGGRSLNKEFLWHYYANRLGLPAPRVNHALLCINGVYFGVYANVEEADDQPFLDDLFSMGIISDPDGEFFKIDNGGGRFTYPSSEARHYNSYHPVAGTTAHTNLIDLMRYVNTEPSSSFASGVSSFIDTDHWLETMALEMSLLDPDGVWKNNNYLLYRIPTTGIWYVVRTDQDAVLHGDPSFWNDSLSGSRLGCYDLWNHEDPLNNPDGTVPPSATDYIPIIVRHPVLLARMIWDTHTAEYLGHVRAVAQDLIFPTFRDVLAERRDLILPYLATDPFQTPSAFRTSIGDLETKLRTQLNFVETERSRLATNGMNFGCHLE